MKEIIVTNNDLCTGYNRCARECPMELANITYQDDDGNIKVIVDQQKCIACGRCVTVCKHGARQYIDDTEQFFNDLADGVPISLIAAPSIRTNIPGYKRLFTYLKRLGVNMIYDVSLGADICIWAHIRYIEQNAGCRLITQPCPVIVTYCEMYRHDLLKRLSPVHSPMGCASIYIKEYQGLGDRIAAISPCMAKTHEFEATGLAEYSITFIRLLEYLEDKNIVLPDEETGFDHIESGLGSLFPMPGGLKENIEYFMGKKLHIEKAEGFGVYEKLDKYAETPEEFLPDIFDVLNCSEGCNVGSAASAGRNVFEVGKTMDDNRRRATEGRSREYYDSVYKTYDDTFDLSRFMREYQPFPMPLPKITSLDIENAFVLLNKTNYEQQNVNCGACGSETCYNMARKIALGVNIPINCMTKTIQTAKEERETNAAMLEQFATIWENVESGIVIIDAETLEVLDLNPAALNMFGGAREEIIGENHQKLFGEHEYPALDLSQDVDKRERKFIRSDGTIIPVLNSATKTVYKGRPVLLESFTDISYMKESEEQKHLLELGERIQLMMNANPHINLLFDSSFNLIDCNPAAISYMGYETKEDMLAGCVERIVNSIPQFQPDGRASIPLAARLMTAAKEGHIKFETEVFMNGMKRIFDIELNKIPYENNFAIVGYFYDITDIREGEMKLARANELNKLQLTKLGLVIRASKIGLWDMEVVRSGSADYSFNFTWSDEFRSLLGYSNETDFPNEIESWSNLIHPDDKDKVLDAFDRHFYDKTGNTPYNVEYRMLAKTGEYAYYRDFCEAFRDKDGNVIRVAGALVDITATKNILFDAERLRVEADAASKSKGDFLANMSHEIRTPMNAIIGMSAIGVNATGIEQKDNCLVKIVDASKHLLGIINDILDMSKIEAGKFELSEVAFDFEKMFQRIANVISFRMEEKNHHFAVYIDRAIPQIMIGDDQRLAQVITNLAGNAIKFTPEEGSIKIHTYFLGEIDGVCSIKISVSDTGIGINPEQQAKLFQSFQQAETSTSRKFGGTGLGLTISKSIVEMMGGEIWIESEAGKGATFNFTIRLKRGEVKRHELAAGETDLKSIRVLAVDDDPYILDDFKGIIEKFGISCDTANSAADAFRIIEENDAYDIYFVDWKMPGIDVMEIAKEFKGKTSAANNSMVVMVSFFECSMVAEEAKEAGVDMFLQKPLFPSTVAHAIEEYLGIKPHHTEETDLGIYGIFEGLHVLLAEDVEINREIVLTLFEPTLMKIDCAVNGAEAVGFFSEAPEKYDMILMDLQMPEMDGYEATRRIRALGAPQAKTVPIIAMTANVFREDVEKCLEAGMNDHLGKPINFDDVLEKIRTYLPQADGDA